MSDNPIFEISFFVWGKMKPYKFKVEQYYTSSQVLRFRVMGKSKDFLIEKRLLLKREPWKIVSKDFKIDDVKLAAEFILRVQQSIDDHLKGPQNTRINPKNMPGNLPE